MKLFSLGRTDLAVSSKLATAVSSIKPQRDNENAAHVRNGKVLWRSPETVVLRTASSRVRRYTRVAAILFVNDV